MSSWSDSWYPPSRPRKATNGIRARTAHGSIGDTWWSRRFIDILESFALGSRLTRGRSYARAGQVVSLQVTAGTVSAEVQGSRSRPYVIKIGLATFPDATWDRIERTLAAQALYSARLLAGEVPRDLEEVFAAAGVALFPAGMRDLTMRCSCPDSAVPCKHLAATFYLLAEAFDDDPFQILRWRGRSREELLAGLGIAHQGTAHQGTADRGTADRGNADRGNAGSGSTGAIGAAGSGSTGAIGAAGVLSDLPDPSGTDQLDRFWLPAQPLPRRPVTLDTMPELLIRQLPVPPQRLGGQRLSELLRSAYQQFGRPGPER